MEMYIFLEWSSYICFYICLELVFSFQIYVLKGISKTFSLFDLQKKAKVEEPKTLDLLE